MKSWAARRCMRPRVHPFQRSALQPRPEHRISYRAAVANLQSADRRYYNKRVHMITRRIVLAGAAALAFTASASAQDYKAKYPELTFAVVPAENASGVTERWTPFVAYLAKELGVKVTLRIANDYAAVIES